VTERSRARDGSAAAVGRPVRPRLRTFRNDGLRFDVRDQGPLDGPVVVLLHGFPERASDWDGVAARLHAAGLRTVAPDQRGYSPGARPGTRVAYRMSALVDDVLALVARIGSPVHLVGHDWGAAVAWRMATEHPGAVRSLTTVSCRTPRPSHVPCSPVLSCCGRGTCWPSSHPWSQRPSYVGSQASSAAPCARAAWTKRGYDAWRMGCSGTSAAGSPGLVPRRANGPPDQHASGDRADDTHLEHRGGCAQSPGCGPDRPVRRRAVRPRDAEGVNRWAPQQAPDAVAEAVLSRIDACQPAS